MRHIIALVEYLKLIQTCFLLNVKLQNIEQVLVRFLLHTISHNIATS